MRESSVDGRLEQLVDLFNRKVLGDSMQLQYTRTAMPVTGVLLCNLVHSVSYRDRCELYNLLLARVRWANNAQVEKSDATVLVHFLRSTFV